MVPRALDEALLIDVVPPEGVYWSYSLGNAWWETIDYGNHQSESQRPPGRGRRRRTASGWWWPTVTQGCPTGWTRRVIPEGPIILRCVRTATAPSSHHHRGPVRRGGRTATGRYPAAHAEPEDRHHQPAPTGREQTVPAFRAARVSSGPRAVEASEADALIPRRLGRCFEHRGGAGFTVHEVLGEAGLGTRAFYRHFAAKEALVLAVFADASAQEEVHLRERMQGAWSSLRHHRLDRRGLEFACADRWP